MKEPASHLRAKGKTGVSACGKQVDEFLLGDSTEDIECRQCRRTQYFKEVHIEEFGEEPDEEDL